MKAHNKNQLNMIASTLDVMDQNKERWQVIPAIGKAVTDVVAQVTVVNTLAESLADGTKGVTITKTNARKDLVASTLSVAGALAAYASEHDDQELLAKVNVTAGKLNVVRGTDLGPVCLSVRNCVNGDVATYAEQGLTENMLADFDSKIAAFNKLIGKPRAKRSTNRASGQQQKLAVAKAVAIVENRLDRLMERFRTTVPDFYAAYEAAREVVDLPGVRNGKNGKNGHDTPQPS